MVVSHQHRHNEKSGEDEEQAHPGDGNRRVQLQAFKTERQQVAGKDA